MGQASGGSAGKGESWDLCCSSAASRSAASGLLPHAPSGQTSPAWANVEVPWTGDVHPDTVIEYFTDVEGHWEYFINFVQRSSILSWEGNSRGVWGPGSLRLKRNGILVFGGDASDKGPGDVRISKLLTRLKKAAPRQVFLIIGNRDLMKLRFGAELLEPPPGCERGLKAAGLDDPWLPTWDPKCVRFEKFCEQEQLPTNRMSKLKWLLHCTMGCQWPTFLTRKDELAFLKGEASDEDVLESYTSSIDPRSTDPWMLEYLKVAQIACVLGDTLFVHGGLQDDSIGFVPGQKAEIETSVHLWAQKLNQWKERQLGAYMLDPFFHLDPSTGAVSRAAEDLIVYGTPGYGTRTVIYYNPFVEGNPVPRSESVQDFLENSGIKRLLTGHQPHGQTPSVVRHMRTGLLNVTCDTSRSDDKGSKVFNPNNNRGVAISLVQIQGPLLTCKGELSNGSAHGFTLHVDPQKDDFPDKLVGRQLIDNNWIKTVVGPLDVDKSKRHTVMAAQGVGWAVNVCEMDTAQACLKLKASYGYGVGDLAVNVEDLTADMLLKRTTNSEVFEEDAIPITKSMSAAVTLKENKTAPRFVRESFMDHSTFVFSFNGVVRTADESQKKIVANMNKLIAAKKRLVFITNDSTLSRPLFWQRIRDLGINIGEMVRQKSFATFTRTMTNAEAAETVQRCSVVTSSQTAAWYLHHHGVKRPFCVVHGTGLMEELQNAGIKDYYTIVDQEGEVKKQFLEPVTRDAVEALVCEAHDADAVVIGWAHQLTSLTIAVAAQLIRLNKEKGINIPVVTCSTDATGVLGKFTGNHKLPCLSDMKIRTVGNGGMAEIICRTAGDDVRAVDCGKPSDVFSAFLRWPFSDGGIQIDIETTCLVGDSMDTDIVMANKLGLNSLLVLTGITSPENFQEKNMEFGMHSPTWVLDSFANALEEKAVVDHVLGSLRKVGVGLAQPTKSLFSKAEPPAS